MSAHEKLWIDIGEITDIPLRGARVVRAGSGDIAIFRTADDEIFALEDRCPHRQGPLSQGIVHDRGVTCPLHNWVISLETGQAREPDIGCTRSFAVRVQEGRVFLDAAAIAPQEG